VTVEEYPLSGKPRRRWRPLPGRSGGGDTETCERKPALAVIEMRTSDALPELTGLPEQERTMSKSIHLFQCGSADLYGLTQDQTGANLPTDECTGRWRLVKTVEFEGDLPPWGIDAAWQESDAAARAGLAENGFFISEGGALPTAFR
jgi:hypothetical protein